MGIFAVLVNIPYKEIPLEVPITLELGILTIFTIFFSFSDIKSRIKDGFQKNKDVYPLTSKEEEDTFISFMDKLQNQMFELLEVMGDTFRIGIYGGLMLLLLIISNDLFLKLGFIQIVTLFGILIQLWALGLNVHRFKTFYELDSEKEFKEQQLMFESINKAANIGNYEILTYILKKQSQKKGIFRSIKDNIISLIKFNIGKR